MRVFRLSTLVVLALVATVAAAQGRVQNFRTHLSGAEEVPPVTTAAQGQAIFRLLPDGGMHYQLMVANIRDVRMAHIHLGPAGGTGPIVAWLYPSEPPFILIPDRSDGVLAAGVLTDASLVGPLSGQTLEDLVAAIRAGNTYVNVHTAGNPLGEIRGQIR